MISLSNVVVFFDLYDTLVQADRGYLEQYFSSEIDKLGDIGVLKNAKMAIEEIVKNNPKLLEEHKIEEMVKYYEDCMNKSIMNVDIYVYNMLNKLKENGYKLCIISDACYTDIEKWNSSLLSFIFDKTVFSCEIGCAKPDPKIYQIAKQMMGNPEKSIFIGDGGHDELYGAKNSGMKTIKAEWFIDRKDEKINRYADYCIKNLDEVEEIINEIIVL